MSNQELVPMEATKEPQQLLELDSRRDAFMNRIRLLWNPRDNSVHLKITSSGDMRTALDIEVPADKASDSFEHPYSYAYARAGESLVGRLVAIEPVPEAA